MPLQLEPAPAEEAARIIDEKQVVSKEAFDILCDKRKARAFEDTVRFHAGPDAVAGVFSRTKPILDLKEVP